MGAGTAGAVPPSAPGRPRGDAISTQTVDSASADPYPELVSRPVRRGDLLVVVSPVPGTERSDYAVAVVRAVGRHGSVALLSIPMMRGRLGMGRKRAPFPGEILYRLPDGVDGRELARRYLDRGTALLVPPMTEVEMAEALRACEAGGEHLGH